MAELQSPPTILFFMSGELLIFNLVGEVLTEATLLGELEFELEVKTEEQEFFSYFWKMLLMLF